MNQLNIKISGEQCTRIDRYSIGLDHLIYYIYLIFLINWFDKLMLMSRESEKTKGIYFEVLIF